MKKDMKFILKNNEKKNGDFGHSIITILFGHRNIHSLENRVFNVICLTTVFIGIFTAILNVFLENPIREIIFSFSATFIAVAFYIASMKFHLESYLKLPMVIFFLGLISVIWMTNQGSKGSSPLFFIILFVIIKIIIDSPYDNLLLLISFFIVIGLSIIEQLKPELIIPYLSESHRSIDVFVSLVICLLMITLLVTLVVKEYQREHLHKDNLYAKTLKDKISLEQALSEIKTLKGIVPICAHCKKIRDDKGYWNFLESYIEKHSDASFSHGLCPECADELYENEDWYKKEKKSQEKDENDS
ncbi:MULTISPECIES: hypothetical protein [unclassified Oceanispirochaeta]|uniref:hypothetical protein n=1 Tax=unclassified Oceanispirochaeta TaxID=2635722 RepID=UPI000E095102|nr:MULTISPECIES: hypothetical protein [unclassified Oceanispirochaeta]MBF9018990.1 hypothetical protein [Oceanispirochaeta sp. M2]NPD75490.1 hypothetical protein [Oceanispirochaeta sp. M1]RDG28658.1 hypothetical protein DV872_25685 [Oceanispirochaeta sp. M1]